MTRDDAYGLAERLGYDPKQVAEIRLTPHQIEVTSYAKDLNGRFYRDAETDVVKQIDTVPYSKEN